MSSLLFHSWLDRLGATARREFPAVLYKRQLKSKLIKETTTLHSRVIGALLEINCWWKSCLVQGVQQELGTHRREGPLLDTSTAQLATPHRLNS